MSKFKIINANLWSIYSKRFKSKVYTFFMCFEKLNFSDFRGPQKRPNFWILYLWVCIKKLGIGSTFLKILSCIYCCCKSSSFSFLHSFWNNWPLWTFCLLCLCNELSLWGQSPLSYSLWTHSYNMLLYTQERASQGIAW